MSAAGKALWYIETHAEQPLALADIAAAAGLAMTAWVIATVFFMGRSLKLRMGP